MVGKGDWGSQSDPRKIVLAFSGGLDTSFCVVHMREKYRSMVITVTVDTGGFSPGELKEIEKRALRLGASRHYTIDGRERVYKQFIAYLIKGNVLRGGTYPLSVGSERVVQAEEVVKIARKEKASAIAHGSTGAGNDQVRFDVAFRVLAPDLKVLAPIRTLGLSREEEKGYLANHGFEVRGRARRYSVNAGLWGTTIGGAETHDSWRYPPEAAFTKTLSPKKAPGRAETVELGFVKGLPVSLNGKRLRGIELVRQLNYIGAKHGVGRGLHVGDTILGIKGRIAFEAPAPLVLVTAHRELEKLVLTRWQQFWKAHLADFYGMLLHEAQYFDPVMRDVEALLDSSQGKVTGTVRVRLYKGLATVIGCRSPHSFLSKQASVYGEETKLWNARDAEGFSRIYGIQSWLAQAKGG